MKTLTLVFLLTLSLCVTFAQPPASPILKLNQPLEQQIKAGETQEFQIALQSGEFMHVEVLQKGVDVVVRLYAPDGQLLLERDYSQNTQTGMESLSYLAEPAGNYKLAVSVGEKARVMTGSYTIELKALRQPTPQDHKRIAAETLFSEAGVLMNKVQVLRGGGRLQESANEAEQALAKYQESLSFWRELNERYGEQQTLSAISSVGGVFENLGQKYLNSGEFVKARESYQKAFQIAKVTGYAHTLIANSENLERVSKKLKTKGVNAELVVQTGPPGNVYFVAFAPDGKTLASGSGSTIQLWDVASGTELRTISGQVKSIGSFALALAPDGKTLASGGITNIQLWDIASGAELRTFSWHWNVTAVAFAPDGKTLASGSRDKTIKLWDIASGTELRTISGHQAWVTAIAFAPDGKTLASGSWDKTIKLWDIASGTELRTFSGHQTELSSIAFAPDGKTLASGSWDKTIKLWDVASGAELHTLSGHQEWVMAVTFAPDGKTLASGSLDKTIKLWDVASGTELRIFSGHQTRLSSIAFAPDGKTLASGGNKTIKLWDVASGAELRTLSGHQDGVMVVALAPDGKTLASGGGINIQLWDIASGAELRTLSGHRNINAVAFAPDGKTLASGSKDYTIKLWDIASGTELRTFSGHQTVLTSIAFAPDGKTLASGGQTVIMMDHGEIVSKGEIELWDIASGTELRTLSGHQAKVTAIAFAPDGKTLVSGNPNNTFSDTSGKITTHISEAIKFWEVTSGRELPLPNPLPFWAAMVKSQLRWGRNFNLKPVNGKAALVAPTSDGQINFISSDTGERLCSLIFLDQKDWVVVTPDGLFDASPGAMKLMHFVISGIEEGYAVVALEQMKDRYYQPNLLPKLLGYDNTPIKEILPFTGEKLFPKLEYKLQEKDQTKLDISLHNRGGGIGEVAVLVNGKTFLQDARPRGFDPNAKDAAFTVDLQAAPLLPGAPNHVEVVARNAEGWLTSPRGVKATYTPAAAAAKPDAELWAIVGGVSDYEGTQLDLNFAAKDAEDFANAIKLGGYRLFGANRVHLQTLTTNNKDPKLLPTKENFRRVFTEFQKAKPNDVLLVYLSGHGVAFRVNGDKVLYNYLTQAATNGDVKDSDVRGKVAITSDELMEWIRLIPTNKNVLVFDTCAAGAFADNLNLALKKDEAGEHLDNQKIAMEDLKYRMGFHILMGAAADKPSYETSQFNQGLLTYALLEGVKFGAVNDKKIVNVSELFQYARNRVPKLAESIGNVNIQTPQIAAPQGDTFPLLQMSNDDSEAIRLEKERPIIMRPRLVNTDDFDDVELEKTLIRQLKAASQPVKRGDAARHSPLVFLETWELPSAIKPSGSYKYDGEQVTVNLKLLRDKQMVGTLTVVGRKKDLPGLVEKIIAELVVAIGKLPKNVVGVQK